jgi:hypothetical protein
LATELNAILSGRKVQGRKNASLHKVPYFIFAISGIVHYKIHISFCTVFTVIQWVKH